jgi:hypothetical protein
MPLDEVLSKLGIALLDPIFTKVGQSVASIAVGRSAPNYACMYISLSMHETGTFYGCFPAETPHSGTGDGE